MKLTICILLILTAVTVYPKDPAKPALPVKQICPVNGEELIPGKIITITNDNRIYQVCCKYCQKKFLKNPEKYKKYGKDMITNKGK
jgi:hypothetical protein